MTKVSVFDVIGQQVAAVSSEDGDRVYQLIDKELASGHKVMLDFKGVDLIVSTFLNAAIGQLYGTYSQEFVRENFFVENLSNDDLGVLKKVVERAKQYFEDKDGFSQSVRNSLSNG